MALEALRCDKTVQEIAAKHHLHPNRVSTWKRQAIEGMSGEVDQRDYPKLSISQQCKLVSLSRSTFYYTPVGVDAAASVRSSLPVGIPLNEMTTSFDAYACRMALQGPNRARQNCSTPIHD